MAENRFREGEEVVIVRSKYKCVSCGGDHGKYYHGGEVEKIRLQSKGRIIQIGSNDKLLLRLKDGRECWFHPGEIDLLDKNQLGKLRRILPGLENISKHPAFEIAEQTAVFLVNGKVYSIGEGNNEEHYLEARTGFKPSRQPLIEVGDFDSLESLVLDRAQLDISRIGEKYANDVQKELRLLSRLDDSLDTPQLIFKQVFPYLQEGQYRDKVSELLGLEEKRKDAKRKDAASPKEKAKATKRLRQIAYEVGIEVKSLIEKIEQEGKEPTKRSNIISKLDKLFGYEEPKPYTGISLLGKALNGRNTAIVEGTVYDLVTGKDDYEKHVQIGTQRFSLVKRKELKSEPKTNFEVGDEVLGIGRYDNRKIERIKGKIVRIKEADMIGVEWENDIGGHNCGGLAKEGHGWYVKRENLENLAKIVIGDGDTLQDLEDKFLIELGKKIRIDALKNHLSRDKLIDLMGTQDAEILAMAGMKEYQGDGFGFVQDDSENYYAYIEVPAFAIKSQFDGNYYFFDRARIGTKVWKDGKRLSYDEGQSIGESAFAAIDNNNHPFLHNRKGKFARFCIGDLRFPTSGEHNGEVIAKRLRRCREMVMFGYTGSNYAESYQLKDNVHFKKNKIELEKLQEMGVPIIEGGSRL